MKLTLTLFSFILTYSSLFAQYSPIPPKDLTLANYSRQEIRTYLLMTEPEDSKVYQLTKKSRNAKIWSYVLYAISTAYLIASIDGFNELAKNPDYDGIDKGLTEALAWGCLGGAAVSLSLGIWQTHTSRKNLNTALRQFR